MKNIKKFVTSLLFLMCTIFNIFADDYEIASNSVLAEEEFRRGVQSFYRGTFSDAILQFEKALSYSPNNGQILEWLGNSYYRAGIEGTAIQQWEIAIQMGYDKLRLQNKIDLVKDRRVVELGFEEDSNYVEAGCFAGQNDDNVYFRQPISILPLRDGSFWTIAYGSNELLKFNANGVITLRNKGPINGFDRPMDIIQLSSGNLLVSEYAGNRLAELDANGKFIKYIGEKGLGNGQMIGPQFLAVDSSDNIFVTDFGNARVVVFDSEGIPLFTFGEKIDNFKGLSAPTGIAIINDFVYVADAARCCIYIFDVSGNYIDILVKEDSFLRPEALKPWNDYILVADTNKVYAVDSTTGTIIEASTTGQAPSRITCAVADINNNIIVTDFKTNQIYIMSKMSELVGGLAVNVERIVAEDFPKVTVEVRVENRKRQPVVGLSFNNFYLTENKQFVQSQDLIGIASNNNICDITLLIDHSVNSIEYNDAIQTAVRDIAQSMNGLGTLRIVSVSDIPITEAVINPITAKTFSPKQLKNPIGENAAIDLGIRLAANDLITAEKKRAIIFLTPGEITQSSFDMYGLVDLIAYLNNNGIRFSTVNLSQNTIASAISYITKQTGGSEYYVYRPEGLHSVVTDIINLPNGLYQLTYNSKLPTNFGKNKMPLEVEVYLLNRSGRDETIYFAPMN